MANDDSRRDLEKRRNDYEVERLARDAVSIPAAAVIGSLFGGPVGLLIGTVAAGFKAIAEKSKRDREWQAE